LRLGRPSQRLGISEKQNRNAVKITLSGSTIKRDLRKIHRPGAEVDASRGKFTVKYPKPEDMTAIGRLAAFRRDYRPAGAFDSQTEMYNIMASTLDVVV
jgi:hypothetical protein